MPADDGDTTTGDGYAMIEDGDAATVEWHHRPAEAVPSPLVRRVPYVECKLEHPSLEPTGFADRFFPDAVPYELGGGRVFYWRPVLRAEDDPAGTWPVACATTEGLAGVDGLPASPPPLVGEYEDGVSLVVDGTVGGDATTATVESYATPDVALVDVNADVATVRIEGERVRVEAGDRQRITLDARRITPAGEGSEPTTVAPELAIRYPGPRELHHPAPGSATRLFPSFGLDLDDLPRSIGVPTVGGELDHDALAEQLGVDLTERPYPERVLWQAFAFTAFDPHSDRVPELAQCRTGHIVLANPADGG